MNTFGPVGDTRSAPGFATGRGARAAMRSAIADLFGPPTSSRTVSSRAISEVVPSKSVQPPHQSSWRRSPHGLSRRFGRSTAEPCNARSTSARRSSGTVDVRHENGDAGFELISVQWHGSLPALKTEQSGAPVFVVPRLGRPGFARRLFWGHWSACQICPGSRRCTPSYSRYNIPKMEQVFVNGWREYAGIPTCL